MKETSGKKVVIAGAGPAGLTAAYEIKSPNINVFERENFIGGISRTAVYKGNHIDIGGHRFFSKNDDVMNWWNAVLPFQTEALNPDKTDLIMLKRSRLSRILWMRKLFDYPLTLSPKTILNLGIFRTFLLGLSYLKVMVFPPKKVENLEDFFISRFGKRLYLQFFKDYTEKVWGVKCSEISSAWGAQRIKGISIKKAIMHALSKKKKQKDIYQKDVETSLIDSFLYPKYGPGQLWERVAELCEDKGVQISKSAEIVGINVKDSKIVSADIKYADGTVKTFECDEFVSSMPIKELISRIKGIDIPKNVIEIAEGLTYRDFITVGVLCNKINIKSDKMQNGLTKDNWIYIQESDVKVGRLQIFNNWSPYLVSDRNKVWMGLEYFCQEGDDMWNMPDNQMVKMAKEEMRKCAIADPEDVVDAVVIRTKKAYPAYFGTYSRFGEIREFLDGIENLYCIGRNGQHRYNNMDHSMLSAMEAANIINGNNISDKSSIWNINTEENYHESK